MTTKTTLFGTAALTLVLAMTSPSSAWAQYGDYVTGDSVDVDLSVLDNMPAPAPVQLNRSVYDAGEPETIIISSDNADTIQNIPDSRISAPMPMMSQSVAAAPAPYVSQPQEISPVPAPVPAENITPIASLAPPVAATPETRVLKPASTVGANTTTVTRKKKTNEAYAIKSTGAPVTYPRSDDSIYGSYRPSLGNDQFKIVAEENTTYDNSSRRVLKKKVKTVETRQVATKPVDLPPATPFIPPVVAPSTISAAEADKQMQAIDRSMSLLAPNAPRSAPVALPSINKSMTPPPPPLPVKTVKTVKTLKAVKTEKPVEKAPAPKPVAAPAPALVHDEMTATPVVPVSPVFKPTGTAKKPAPVSLIADAPKIDSAAAITPPPSISPPIAAPAASSAPQPLVGTQLPISAPASSPMAPTPIAPAPMPSAPPATVTTTTTTTVEEVKKPEPLTKTDPVENTPAPAPVPVEAPVESLVDKTAATDAGPADLSAPPPFKPSKETIAAAPALKPHPRPVPVEAPLSEPLADKTSIIAAPSSLDLPTANRISQPISADLPAADPAKVTPPPSIPAASTTMAAPVPSKTAEVKPVDAVKPAANGANLTLTFEGNTTAISPSDAAEIKKMLADLPQNASRISIAAYASGSASDAGSARKVSLARSLAVRTFLMDNGIKPARIDVRALGSASDKKPLDRVDMVFPQ